MEKVKKKLKSLCRPGAGVRPDFAWPANEEPPFEVRLLTFALGHRPLNLIRGVFFKQVVKETIELMRYHRALMLANWELLDVEKIQSRWYVRAKRFTLI